MIHLHHSFPGPDTLELIESGSSPVPDPQPSLIHSLRPSHSFPSPDQSKADPEKTYSGSRGQKGTKKMVKKLLNISSWDPVLTCPDEDDADSVQAGVLCFSGWLQLALRCWKMET
jgi:hypothetical protein